MRPESAAIVREAEGFEEDCSFNAGLCLCLICEYLLAA